MYVLTVVTPRAGVWIEISYISDDIVGAPVTPRAGVWIEIFWSWVRYT